MPHTHTHTHTHHTHTRTHKHTHPHTHTETRGRFGAAALGDVIVAVGGVGRLTAEAFNGSAFAPYQNLPEIKGDVRAVNFRNDSVCLVC